MNIRIGLGHDIHALVENRELWLGGVKIPYEKGLKGHSDADALLHAIMDAILGALSLGDIGKLFPDTDAKYKGISSSKLVLDVMKLVKEKQFRVGNLDCIIHCEQPKISPHREKMKIAIAQLLETTTEQISIKAGTNEGFDAIGKKEAIACQAIVLMTAE